MTQYEIYVFILCFIVFVIFVSLFSYMLYGLIKLYLKSLKAGLEDDELKTEYRSALEKSKKTKLYGCVVSLIVGVVFVAFFAFSLFVNIQENMFFEKIPTLKMVNSGSMSRIHPSNTYLKENGLDNQFQTFDLIYVYKAPAEKDLKLYDVVLYEVDHSYVVHRIVGIEEPDDKHPDDRYFLCKGDANEYADRFPVYYSQIKAIYKGKRIPFIGSFVSFLQSPAGWLCLLLVVFATFGMPVLEKKLERENFTRLVNIGFIDSEGKILVNITSAVEKETAVKR